MMHYWPWPKFSIYFVTKGKFVVVTRFGDLVLNVKTAVNDSINS